MSVYCNPLNFSYRYQFNKSNDGSITASREAADPSMILFQGKYLIFPSMTAGFLYSEDLVKWNFWESKNLPAYDYAPDVRAVGEYLYFCASNKEQGIYYRTKDPFSDIYEQTEGAFPFWDPNLFVDEDGRFYFYWGSSAREPLYGIELDSTNMQPIGERVKLCSINTDVKGFERNGENHVPSRSKEEMEMILANLEKQPMPESMKEAAKDYILERPYMEGIWVNKHNGRYYLQYGTPSSGRNIYGDGVYVSDRPLGPYRLAKNNPYSYKPGGFLPGAGHGSTMEDLEGKLWHVSTMRICVNHNFERRIGLWPAGYDEDGELFCNQRYGDWPTDVDESRKNPWAAPEWMLLSYHAKAAASSFAASYGPEKICDENVRTWWKAENENGCPWVTLDLRKEYNVHAIQINFADDQLKPELPENFALTGALMQERFIDTVQQKTRWLLEGSIDGERFFTICDKRETDTDLPHDLILIEEGMKLRYVRLTVTELPYNQTACVSGLRVFGLGEGKLPGQVQDVVSVLRTPLDLDLRWEAVKDSDPAVGYVVCWGCAPDKLYHSYQVFEHEVSIGALVKGQPLYIRVDSFNENGITEGIVKEIEAAGC